MLKSIISKLSMENVQSIVTQELQYLSEDLAEEIDTKEETAAAYLSES